MRHRKSFNHLSRKKGHRDAMLANMASSLIIHKRIKTTVAKAKALKAYVEPLITKSKDDTTHSRRVVFSYLSDKVAVSELFRDVSPKILERPGGYTRIIKLGKRLGDNAEMCIIELVDYNETMLAAKAEEKPKTTRRRRGTKKKSKTQDEQQVSVTGETPQEPEKPTEAGETEEKQQVESSEKKDTGITDQKKKESDDSGQKEEIEAKEEVKKGNKEEKKEEKDQKGEDSQEDKKES